MGDKVFTKLYKRVDEQVQQFAARGMVVDIPIDEAAKVLRSITYYRFSGYALPFRDTTLDLYTNKLKFSDVVALYRFDYLASYMHHATVLRNLCAHHCRIFDFPYSKLKAPPQEFIFTPLKTWIKNGLAIRADRPLIYQLALIYHLLKPTDPKVFDRTEWKKTICEHFGTLPSTIENRVRGYVEFEKDAVNSPLWT